MKNGNGNGKKKLGNSDRVMVSVLRVIKKFKVNKAQVGDILIALRELVKEAQVEGAEDYARRHPQTGLPSRKELSCKQIEYKKPTFTYFYPPSGKFTLNTLMQWFNTASCYHRVALRYETQEAGLDSVDAKVKTLVNVKYVAPICAELLRCLKKVPEDIIM